MSVEGVKLAASVFETIQNARQELIRMGATKDAVATPSGHQDIMLGQMLNKMNDAVKEEFMELVDMKSPIHTRKR